MNPTIYKQLDSRWSGKPYPTYSSSFGGNGCGCCACVHVAMEQERYKNWTPESLRPWMVNQGFAYVNQGTTWSGITETLKHIGHKTVVCVWNDPMSSAWKELNKGNRIGVLLVDNGSTPDGTYWTASGHYVAFTDYKVKGGQHWFYIKDSGGRNHDGWFCYEKSIKGALPKLWIVERLGKAPTPTPTPTPKKGKYTGSYPAPKKYLEYGDKGTEVTKLQKYLNWSFGGQKGFTKIAEDGDFGSDTQKWSIIFQEKTMGAGSGDGLVGAKTIAKMKEYGGYTPTPTLIDISAVQENIDWAKVKKAGISGAIIKCGYRGYLDGKLKEDTEFLNHIRGAHKAGLPVGIYFFTEAITAAEGKAEADYAIKLWKKAGIPISYPIAVDTEYINAPTGEVPRANNLSKAKRTECVGAFCKEIKAKGYTPMIYASTAWLNNNLDMSKLPYDVWCAQYYKECQYKGKYIIWQYTSEGKIDGINGVVDLNKCYISPKKVNPPKDPEPTPGKKSYPGNYPNVDRVQMLIDEAIRLAWPVGTASSKYKWKGGSATAAFTKALDKVYPEHNSWGEAPSRGCSCDVFVGTIVRSSGIDTKFPRGLDEQETYKPSGMFKYVLGNADMYKQSIYGDIIWYDYSGPGGHVLIRGKDCIYQAGYQSTYGHTTSGHGEIKDVEPKVIIFRPRQYLEKGDTGINITRLQKYLNWYTNGEFFKKCGDPDGNYGSNTLKYVKKMQTDFFGAKEADGKVGPKTIAKMKAVKK